MGRHRRLLSALIGGALAGCAGSVPTYAEDVAPRLARSCVGCHAVARPGRPGLGTLEDVRRSASAMLFALDQGFMPPGGIDRSGACGTFEGPAPFTAEDREVLGRWVEAGMPGPDPGRPDDTDAAAAVPFDRRVDLVLPVERAPGDDHRCFLVDAGLDAPALLLGVSAPDAGVLHHAMVFAPAPGAEGTARALEDQDPAPGWSCPGVPMVPGPLVFVWVPGRETLEVPPGTGVALAPGPLVVQVHVAPPEPEDASPVEVALSLLLAEPSPRASLRPLSIVPVATSDFVLPPGAPRIEVVRQVRLEADGPLEVFGVLPHLHSAGVAASLWTEEGACLVDAPRYDFAWQELAFYEEPVAVDPRAPLSLTCAWNTLDRSTPTPWGESSTDEMCTIFLFTSP